MTSMNVPGGSLKERLYSLLQWHVESSERIAKMFWKLGTLVAAVLVFLVSLAVFTRYFLNFVPVWIPELSGYLGIWIALLLMGPLVRLDNHLQFEAVFQRFSLKTRQYVRAVQLVLVILLGYLLFNWGLVYAVRSGFNSTSPTMDFPMFRMYLSLPVGGIVLMYFASAKLVQILDDKDTLDKDYRARFQEEAEEGAPDLVASSPDEGHVHE